MELDAQKFVDALVKNPDVRKAVEGFIQEHNLAVSATELIAIAKMVCEAAAVACPIINDL